MKPESGKKVRSNKQKIQQMIAWAIAGAANSNGAITTSDSSGLSLTNMIIKEYPQLIGVPDKIISVVLINSEIERLKSRQMNILRGLSAEIAQLNANNRKKKPIHPANAQDTKGIQLAASLLTKK